MISMLPRVQREADRPRLAARQAEQPRAFAAAEDLAEARDRQDERAERRVELPHEVHAQTDAREEQRREERRHELADRGARALAQVRGVAQRHARQERAEHGVDPDPVRERGREQREHDREGEHARRPARVRLDPGQHAVDRPAPGAEQGEREARGEHDDARGVGGRTGARRAEQGREDHPADQVVQDGGGDHRHPEVGLVQVEIHHGLRDHGQGRDRERRGQEEREEPEAAAGLEAELGRDRERSGETQSEGSGDARNADAERHLAAAEGRREVDL
jgi:hypothetical protein